MDGKRPLLLFPAPAHDRRVGRPHPGPSYHLPPKANQVSRFGPQLSNLANAMSTQRAAVMTAPDCAEPEKVLVFEIVGAVDAFVKAVRKTGLEWLIDFRLEDIESDDFYEVDYRDGSRKAKKVLDGRLFFTMTDERALQQMMSLWDMWKKDETLPRGFTPWRDVFSRLSSVRYWEAKDRLSGTGLAEDWSARVGHGEQSLPIEIELWYREDRGRREAVQTRISELVSAIGGQVVASALIEDIRYHAVAAQIPASEVELFLSESGRDAEVVRCDDVMFFRPTGQVAAVYPESDESDDGSSLVKIDGPSGPPIAALFDGMPVQMHPLLARHVIIDDPDDWAADYPVNSRQHGTAMASLIIHGDLASGAGSAPAPLLVRPIMRPGPPDFHGNTVERIPDTVLPADVMMRAVVRLFEGESDEAAVAPSVRVVNLSIGDAARPFSRAMSPWARCVDWLSSRYGILFVISAGNNRDNLETDLPRDGMAGATEEARRDAFILAGVRSYDERRLISPGESCNAITIGSVHSDWSGDVALHRDFCEPFVPGTLFPSPVSRMGLGLHRAVKPDLVHSGGRAVYSEVPAHNGGNAIARLRRSNRAPGHRVASPTISATSPVATMHAFGTSNAAALTTRDAVTVFTSVIQPILDSASRPPMNRGHQSAMIKVLLAHGARWPEDSALVERALSSTGMNGRQTRAWRTRLYGYGVPNLDRVTACTGQRATLLGWGDIDSEEAHVYMVPIPPSLSGRRESIRLSATVGWFTPINPRHQEYRRAALSMEFSGLTPAEMFGSTGEDVAHNASGRGTLIHRILEGRRATVIGDDDVIEVRVNCRAAAGDLDDSVPYAIAVTLEVAEESDVPVYEEIRARVGIAVAVNA